jgi:hypothetical protein
MWKMKGLTWTQLKVIISFEALYLEESYQGICFGHTFSKAWKYATIDEFFCKKLTYVSIKTTQGNL